MSKGALIIGGVFLLIGVAIIFSGISSFYVSSQSSNWPSTTGIITKSEIYSYEETEHSDNDGLSMRTTYYEPKIEYKYTVDNIEYISNNIGILSEKYVIENDAIETLDKYPIGENITVYYNPSEHSYSLLETEISSPSSIWISMIFGLILLILGLLILLGGIKKRRSKH